MRNIKFDTYYRGTYHQTAGLIMECNPLDIAKYLENHMNRYQYDNFIEFMVNKALDQN